MDTRGDPQHTHIGIGPGLVHVCSQGNSHHVAPSELKVLKPHGLLGVPEWVWRALMARRV